MAFAIKAKVIDPQSKTFLLADQKTMYGGKLIFNNDTIFLITGENDGGKSLFARGIVISAEAVAKKRDVARQTPRVDRVVGNITLMRRPLGRFELKPFTDWGDGRPGTELNFKLYRQATNKVVGNSDDAAAFLNDHF